jgi:anti-sigma factor RsiW
VNDNGDVSDERPIDCNELVELVSDYLDGTLDLPTRARFDEHLLGCDGCEHYLQQFRATVTTLGNVPEDSLAPALRNKLLTAFRDWSSPTS